MKVKIKFFEYYLPHLTKRNYKTEIYVLIYSSYSKKNNEKVFNELMNKGNRSITLFDSHKSILRKPTRVTNEN